MIHRMYELNQINELLYDPNETPIVHGINTDSNETDPNVLCLK